MPVNAGHEYAQAEGKYYEASSIPEKIKALQEMLSTAPSHKGTENLRNGIKQKIAKYKELQEKTKKASKRGSSKFSIKKEGAATIVLIGITNSGKSTLLKELTNAKVDIADYPHTTTKPEVGTLDYKKVKIQVIEIPPFVENLTETEDGPALLGIIRLADLIVIVLNLNENINTQIKLIHNELEQAAIKKEIIAIGIKGFKNKEFLVSIDKLKKEIWSSLGLIKIYTKNPGKKPEPKPVTLNKNSTVKDLAANVHKDFLKKFRFARIWGPSSKHDGQQVGLEHILKDNDIVELHLK
ncbi:hypothetical protein CL617_05475 [archaeon]|nr:hypothetical protein [archaeon]|tara:strand:- start:1826 stop:2713 length:888 start_codon:yes stop_codon:yes gene_type:complete